MEVPLIAVLANRSYLTASADSDSKCRMGHLSRRKLSGQVTPIRSADRAPGLFHSAVELGNELPHILGASTDK